MASLRKTPAGSYIICFRYNGGQNQRALKTKNPDAAKAMKGRVEHTMFRIASGDLAIPSGVDAADFIVWGDAALERASQRAETKRETPSLEESIEPYLDAHRGLKDDSSLRTERSHLRN